MTANELNLMKLFTVTFHDLLKEHYGNAPITNLLIREAFCNYVLNSFYVFYNVIFSILINKKTDLFVLWYYLRIVCISLINNFALLRQNTTSEEAYINSLKINFDQLYKFSMMISFFDLSLSINEIFYDKVNGLVIFLYKNSFLYRLIGLTSKSLMLIFLPFILFEIFATVFLFLLNQLYMYIKQLIITGLVGTNLITYASHTTYFDNFVNFMVFLFDAIVLYPCSVFRNIYIKLKILSFELFVLAFNSKQNFIRNIVLIEVFKIGDLMIKTMLLAVSLYLLVYFGYLGLFSFYFICTIILSLWFSYANVFGFVFKNNYKVTLTILEDYFIIVMLIFCGILVLSSISSSFEESEFTPTMQSDGSFFWGTFENLYAIERANLNNLGSDNLSEAVSDNTDNIDGFLDRFAHDASYFSLQRYPLTYLNYVDSMPQSPFFTEDYEDLAPSFDLYNYTDSFPWVSRLVNVGIPIDIIVRMMFMEFHLSEE